MYKFEKETDILRIIQKLRVLTCATLGLLSNEQKLFVEHYSNAVLSDASGESATDIAKGTNDFQKIWESKTNLYYDLE